MSNASTGAAPKSSSIQIRVWIHSNLSKTIVFTRELSSGLGHGSSRGLGWVKSQPHMSPGTPQILKKTPRSISKSSQPWPNVRRCLQRAFKAIRGTCQKSPKDHQGPSKNVNLVKTILNTRDCQCFALEQLENLEIYKFLFSLEVYNFEFLYTRICPKPSFVLIR